MRLNRRQSNSARLLTKFKGGPLQVRRLGLEGEVGREHDVMGQMRQHGDAIKASWRCRLGLTPGQHDPKDAIDGEGKKTAG